ncbi:YlxR family protein [Thermosyntropha sp.]|uniref:RNase P modulator RnpM n=1 Tax=Thermosyntropha sp. TaxID=2740820 RepID=UPI0025D6ACE8|nr:YlxR family protein [Thermosyntropha sp.]MBO8159394.1 YlxR family protein [Thermosyntropha sp.]
MVKTRKIPQRMCVGCREMKNKRDLIRIVRTPDGKIEIDSTGKKSGRGAYICPNIECLNQAIKGKRLQKALEQDIPTEVFTLLKEKISEINL